MFRLIDFCGAALVILSIAGCAHHRDVRPGAEGVHRVVIVTEDTEEAAQDALDQANHFCKEREGGRYAAILEEAKKYTGSMKEEDYKTGKVVAKTAQAVGSAAWIFGGQKESAVGGVMGIGGGVADSALGKGYTVEMKFRCK